MKKLLFLFALGILFTSISAIAQEDLRAEKSAEIQAQRKIFYEKELQFTDAEAKAFWPIYEAHQEELKQFKNRKNRPKLELMSDAEAENFLDMQFQREEQILAARKKFVQNLKGKIAVRKIASLPQTERKFKKGLLRYYKGNRGQGRSGMKGERGGKRHRDGYEYKIKKG